MDQASEVGDDPELYLEVVDPNDLVLAAVNVNRIERSQGFTGGVRAVLEEEHGLFTIEDKYLRAEQRIARRIQFGEAVGKPVSVVHRALTFLGHIREPNKLRVSVRHAPPERGYIDRAVDISWSQKLERAIDSTERLLRSRVTRTLL